MKTKLILSTETYSLEHWTDLPIIPRIKEWIRIPDFVSMGELSNLKQSATCWSGEKGIVDVVEHRKSNEGNYTELLIWCED
jgi:hypothetical protein